MTLLTHGPCGNNKTKGKEIIIIIERDKKNPTTKEGEQWALFY